jgi:hypothetical protein
VTYVYSISGPKLIYDPELSELSPKVEIVSVCTSNGSWHPNPTGVVCTQLPNQGLSATQLTMILCHNYATIFCEGDCDTTGPTSTTTDSTGKYSNNELLDGKLSMNMHHS